MRGLLIVIAFSAAVGCAAESSQDSLRRKCGQLREHLIELRLAGTHVDVTAHRAAISGALGDSFVERCSAELTETQLRCALAATDSVRALDCSRSTSSQN